MENKKIKIAMLLSFVLAISLILVLVFSSPFNRLEKPLTFEQVQTEAKETKQENYYGKEFTFVQTNAAGETRVETYLYGANIVFPVVERTGYTFTGWKAQGATEFFSLTQMPAQNLTLTAQWKINTFSVNFVMGFTWDDEFSATPTEVVTKTIDYNTAVSDIPAAPAKVGHTFIGWRTYSVGRGDINFSTANYDFSAITSNVDVAPYYEINSYTATFNTNGGSAVSPITLEYNTMLFEEMVTDPTKEGYIFTGWDKPLGIKLTENMTFNAVWEIKKYNVQIWTDWTYNDVGDVTAVKIESIVNHFDKVQAPATPSKTGYTFVGWYIAEVGAEEVTFIKEYDFNTPVSSNLMIAAKFTKNSYTIEFDPNGGYFI